MMCQPCEAIDAGFFRWTDHPDRIVEFDARIACIHPIQTLDNETSIWSYGYLSEINRRNKYSLTPNTCRLTVFTQAKNCRQSAQTSIGESSIFFPVTEKMKIMSENIL